MIALTFEPLMPDRDFYKEAQKSIKKKDYEAAKRYLEIVPKTDLNYTTAREQLKKLDYLIAVIPAYNFYESAQRSLADSNISMSKSYADSSIISFNEVFSRYPDTKNDTTYLSVLSIQSFISKKQEIEMKQRDKRIAEVFKDLSAYVNEYEKFRKQAEKFMYSWAQNGSDKDQAIEAIEEAEKASTVLSEKILNLKSKILPEEVFSIIDKYSLIISKHGTTLYMFKDALRENKSSTMDSAIHFSQEYQLDKKEIDKSYQELKIKYKI
jgi:hypothetical protein